MHEDAPIHHGPPRYPSVAAYTPMVKASKAGRRKLLWANLRYEPLRTITEFLLFRLIPGALSFMYCIVGAFAMFVAVWSAYHGIIDGIGGMLHGSGEEAFSDATIALLSLLDMAMVVNVVYQVVGGSYFVYVKEHVVDSVFPQEAQRPPAFFMLTGGGLKEKMAGSLVGVTSVYLTRVVIKAPTPGGLVSHEAFIQMVAIHGFLIAGFLAYVVANWFTHKTHNGAPHDNVVQLPAKPADAHQHAAKPEPVAEAA